MPHVNLEPHAGADPFLRLRAPAPKSPDDLCGCDDQPPMKLMQARGYNPLYCMRCHREVPPERLALTVRMTDAIADWCSVYDAIDRLWLDSGAYEQWAARELATLESAVNVRGLALRATLDPVRRCYYWLFDDTLSPRDDDPRRYPICDEAMTPFVGSRGAQRVCERCSLVAADD